MFVCGLYYLWLGVFYLDEFAVTSSCNAHKVSFTILQWCFEVNHWKVLLPFASHDTFCPLHMFKIIAHVHFN